MIRDLVRAACVIVVMAAACSLIIETRMRLAVIDVVHRQAASHVVPVAHPVPVYVQQQQAGPITRLGQATIGLADAALGVVW